MGRGSKVNAQRALNGAFHGLRSTRGKQSAFAHDLLSGLEALTQERMWRTPYCGGEDQQGLHEELREPIFAWTEVVWQRKDGAHG